MTERESRDRFQHLLRDPRWQVARYLLVGSFNTAFSFSIYVLLLWMGSPIPLASLGSIVFGICLSFVTLGKFVFVSQLQGRFQRFLVTWVFLYGFNVGTIWLFVRAGLGAYAAGFVAGIITAAVSYLLQRWYVFPRSEHAPGDGQG